MKCLICRRSSNGNNHKLDLENKICVCGRPLTSRVVSRLKFWMCRRKRRYGMQQAQIKSEKYATEKQLNTHTYKCPFCKRHHIGKINEILAEYYVAA